MKTALEQLKKVRVTVRRKADYSSKFDEVVQIVENDITFDKLPKELQAKHRLIVANFSKLMDMTVKNLKTIFRDYLTHLILELGRLERLEEQVEQGRKIVMYLDDDMVEHREVVVSEEQIQFIVDNYSNVEVRTVEYCLDNGIGVPS